MSAEFTDETRARIVRKYRRIAKAMLTLSIGSFLGSVASIVVLGTFEDGNKTAGWLLAAFVLFGIGATSNASRADEFAYGRTAVDLDDRLEQIEFRALRARELADSAHNRIAQIERMGQQGRVVIPDTLNVRLTRDNEGEAR